ncbi:hypothetical protein DMH25_38300 [Streptomyces sp. WAC 01325]|nr:hypothetical protein [Streptomyces sp. Lzd4kr]RSM91303.1 hypothetical protein DMH25_38300 [Streptomyces sp. WAC 01325]RSO03100.1 hypothetical protein DMH26_12590 [Streptomyces sp. WAC 05379]WCH97549.1 hypothetical protein POD33_11120 [Streptomyces moderatus]
MLRSVLVAAFSAVVTFGALGGVPDARSDVSADTHWPVTAVRTDGADVSVTAVDADSGERT